MPLRGFRYRAKKEPSKDDMFREIRLYIPMSIYEMLAAKGQEVNLPLSKLTSMALDNEFELQNSFHYPIDYELEEIPFVQDAYAAEAAKILEALKKIKSGLALDQLVLCRRDIGIASKRDFLLAFRELVKSGLIESYYPENSAFRYDLTYRYWRVKPDDTKVLKKAAKKTAKYEMVDGEGKD